MLKRSDPFVVSEMDTENQEWALWAWHSHSWEEIRAGYFECKFCGMDFTSTMGLTLEMPLCEHNPILNKWWKKRGLL